jgi:hypothetical protein
MARVVAGTGAEYHWMSLEARRGSSETEENIEKAVKKLTITTSSERQRGSPRPRRWLGACCCCLPLGFWEY